MGAMRRPSSDTAQRSVYGHKGHGVGMTTWYLPNGMTGAVYGPTSSRRHDLWALEQSNIDREILLAQMQMIGRVYKFYGDKAYQNGNFQCITAAHQETDGIPLTEREICENSNLNKARISIEWSYGSVKQLWPACDTGKHFKFAVDKYYIANSIKVMHLFTNCLTCWRGNGASGIRTFAHPPPSFDEYLQPR